MATHRSKRPTPSSASEAALEIRNAGSFGAVPFNRKHHRIRNANALWRLIVASAAEMNLVSIHNSIELPAEHAITHAGVTALMVRYVWLIINLLGGVRRWRCCRS